MGSQAIKEVICIVTEKSLIMTRKSDINVCMKRMENGLLLAVSTNVFLGLTVTVYHILTKQHQNVLRQLLG